MVEPPTDSPSDERAFRQDVLRRCLALLAAHGPLSAKGLARRLVGTDSRVSKRVVNSVLSLEGAAAVAYDRAAYTYSVRSDTGAPG